jgi:hypothetical protein
MILLSWRQPRVLFSLALVACLACSSSVDPATEPRSIEITTPGGKAIAALVGVQFGLAVVVKNAAGVVISSGDDHLTFVSRNPAVASVNNTGLVSTVSLGSTYIVAALPLDGGTLQDSIVIVVGKNISDSGSP